VSLTFDDNSLLTALLGSHNSHLRHLESCLPVEINNRGNALTLVGPEESVTLAKSLLEQLWDKIQKGHDVTTQDIDAGLRFMNKNNSQKAEVKSFYEEKSAIKTYKNKLLSPRSPNQSRYIEAIRTHDMVFGIGPAGTGKTYLAVACAVEMYKQGLIERMVFCRPAVEAGEQLGFLPGDMLEKIDPYLRPIYDALHDMMPPEDIPKKMEKGDIEIAPLAFMRGRTLKNAFVVLDEAQNATAMQMKMFLTRMGEGTRMVITGDPTQTDLKKGQISGLKDAMETLDDIEEIPFIHFKAGDVVRHRLVSKIILAYDKKGS